MLWPDLPGKKSVGLLPRSYPLVFYDALVLDSCLYRQCPNNATCRSCTFGNESAAGHVRRAGTPWLKLRSQRRPCEGGLKGSGAIPYLTF